MPSPAAVGLDTARGDQLVVESTTFDKSYATNQVTELTQAGQTDLYWRIGTIAGAVILLFALLFYVQRLLRNLRLASADAWVPVMKPLSEAALSGSSSAGGSMLGGGMDAQLQAAALQGQLADVVSTPRLEQIMKPHKVNPEDEQLQKVLTRMTEDNPASVAEIIQMWLSEDEKRS